MTLSEQIENAMSDAISCLEGCLRCSIQESETHRVIIIEGWNDGEITRRAIAHYLVGLQASAIDCILHIRASLDNTPEDRLEIYQSVIRVLGDNNQISRKKRNTDRNPWIAEGIWHFCMVIAARRFELHPNGRIIALDHAHVIAKDHGLDVSAIYENENSFGLSIIEAKTYIDNPNGAINDAVTFFKEVDGGKHSARIRQTVQVMRSALPPDQQPKITNSFWKRERTYIPNPHYAGEIDIDWTNSRPSFRELKPKPNLFDRMNVIIMPNGISDIDNFFDQISDEMRNFAGSLQ